MTVSSNGLYYCRKYEHVLCLCVCIYVCAVMSCNNAHDKRCTITVLYSIVGDDCLHDSDRVSGRNRQVGCSNGTFQSLLIGDRPVFLTSWAGFSQ